MLIIILNFFSYLGLAQDNHPVSWKFSSEEIAPLTYRISLSASIKDPYHIYPQQSFDAGLGMPTEILFKEDSNVEFIGKMEEKGSVAQQTAGEAVPYYSKAVTFSQTLKLKAESATTLAFTIKYMACTNEMCLPPSKKEFTLALNNRDSAAVENKDLTAGSNKGEEGIIYKDFDMLDADGEKISSREITSKSKYTFIDFWASWCIPCRAQGRELIPIYDKYRSMGFNVIGISLDTDAGAWKKAIAADKYTWTNLSDLKGFESELSKRYNITAIPRNFLIDYEGNIVARNLHGKELEAKLSELFKTK